MIVTLPYNINTDMKHKHHILPKHMGGTDRKENIVELSIEEHAEAHRKLYEEHGFWQDKCAWLALSQQISIAEAIKMAQQNADKSWMHSDEGKEILRRRWDTRRKNGTNRAWNKGLKKNDHPGLQKLSERNKELRKDGLLANIGDLIRGKPRSQQHKDNLKKSFMRISKKKCPHCEKEMKPGMYARWHGDKCKWQGK